MVGREKKAPRSYTQVSRSEQRAVDSVLLGPAVVAPVTEYGREVKLGNCLKTNVTKISSRVCLVVVDQARGYAAHLRALGT